MSYGIYSDEVAEDYRRALEDLTMNSRYEISNLTVIAKENTEHALAISEALKTHIKQTAPSKKLPAFYVLDSVVKNVGTPYTLFFGRNLYSTFMEAYALVDNVVRRKMEEMLKTWKEPVPGSMDTRPVFPADITRPIETALVKARTSALQAQQEYARSQQQQMLRGRPSGTPVPYRETPTPPNAFRQSQYPPPGYGPSPVDSYSNLQPYNGVQVSQRQYATPPPSSTQPVVHQSSATAAWQQHKQPAPRGIGAYDASIDTLNSDIANLISSSKSEFAQNPYDGSIQTRLKALLDLQSILQSQKLPPDQLALIRDQVSQLYPSARPSSTMPISAPKPVVVSQPSVQPTLSSLFGDSNALAALLASTSTSSTPVPTSAATRNEPIRSPKTTFTTVQHPPAPAAAAIAPVDPNSLLEKLRAAGMLPPPLTATSTPPAPQVAVTKSLPLDLTASLASLLPRPQTSSTRPPLKELPNDVILKPASLKIPRPHLISLLYERLGAPCTQCGRRFLAGEEGRKKKTAHMDWHFRVHQRMAEAEKRGQHRSWYVDELDWIKSRESEDDYLQTATTGGAEPGNGTSQALPAPKVQYVPVPDDPGLANSICPICQEKFEMKWLDDAQEFVWIDAIKVGGRIYHASCHAEAKRDTPAARATPDPILGKRKNEDEHIPTRTKIKTEPLW